jgi:hypothetical protein
VNRPISVNRLVGSAAIVLLCLFQGAVAAGPKEDIDKLEKHRCPKPKIFALVFSNGYAGDSLPKDDKEFESLLLKIRDGGFNVVHCTFTPERLELCKKHGILMMIDLLAPEHHVYKSPEKAQAICEKLRDNPTVWGYNIWNDPVRKTGEGRRRDVNNVRRWDPTHPAFSGTYRVEGMSHLVNADIMGYYDFHWKRGTGQHFPHLLAYQGWAKERDAWFYSWLSATSGIAGKGNYNRCLWSANTGIAFGMKGILWFLGTDLMDAKTQEWTEAGKDILKVQKDIAPLAKILPTLGQPTAIYSTNVTKTMNNDPLPGGKKEMLPAGLEKHGFPKDHWLEPREGEFVVGFFKGDVEYAYVANHNAYVGQKVALATKKEVSRFDRGTGKWERIAAEAGVVRFELKEGGGELLRFEK